MTSISLQDFLDAWKDSSSPAAADNIIPSTPSDDASSSSDCKNKKSKKNSRWVPLTEFKLFPKLPLELRMAVWKLYLDMIAGQSVLIYASPSGLRVNYITPTLLRTCHDSRIEVLASMSAEFGNNLGGGKKVYFNFEKDGLAFPDTDAASEFFGAEYREEQLLPTIDKSKALKQKLKYLIVGTSGWYGPLALTQDTFDHCGQPKHIMIARKDRSQRRINLNLTGTPANSVTQDNINVSKGAGNTAPTPAKTFTPVVEALTWKATKERLFALENGPRPPKRTYKPRAPKKTTEDATAAAVGTSDFSSIIDEAVQSDDEAEQDF